jgi:predicted AAA+ superfamily ATPase
MPTLFERPALMAAVRAALARSPAVALLGPRQVGKTTLARTFVDPDDLHYLDLEDPTVEAQIAQPMSLLEPMRGLVVIDEVQRAPELFKVLRVLVDRPGAPARFLLLGSASPQLLRQTSESLAGRAAVIEMGGFTIDEVPAGAQPTLWWRGGHPRSFLADSDEHSRAWRRDYLRLVLERDLPALGINVPAPAMQRFWSMLAHLNGQIWNAAHPARALGVNESTVRRHLDHLTQLYMVREPRQAPGQVAQDLPSRQRSAPRVAGHRVTRRAGAAPLERRVVGRFRHRADPAHRPSRRRLLLGDSQWRRARPAAVEGRTPRRRGDQARRRAAPDAFDDDGAG